MSRYAILAGLAIALLPAAAQALSVESLEASLSEGVYRVALVAQVDAPVEDEPERICGRPTRERPPAPVVHRGRRGDRDAADVRHVADRELLGVREALAAQEAPRTARDQQPHAAR